ncbi:MAG: sigma-70 family RNA polymerase sigma factor [Planctomycetota bacterium]
MTTLAPSEVTRILATLSDGDRSAAAELLPLVYGELRVLADRYLRNERVDHTLQATALVHEAYLRLGKGEPVKWENRGHFFRVAAAVMRHILVNHARDRARLKRGGDRRKLPLDDAVAVFEERALDLVALDEALTRLAAFDTRLSRVVELRFFGGLTVDETAEVLGVSPRTVQAGWSTAKLWLLREISAE